MGNELEYRLTIAYLLALYVAITVYFESALRPVTRRDPATRARRLTLLGLWLPIVAYLAAPFRLPGFEYFIGWPPILRWLCIGPAMAAMMLRIWAFRAELPNPAEETGPAGFVRRGPYRWIRTPGDLSTILLALAIAGMTANGYVILWVFIAACFLRYVVIEREQRQRIVILGDAYREYADRTGCLLLKMKSVSKAEYAVPQRFGISTVLVLVTLLSILFSILRAANLPPWVQLYIGSQILAVCLAQIFVARAPRGASALAGAVLLPTWIIVAFLEYLSGNEIVFAAIFLAAFGSFIGYCVGTFAAGFFLIVDMVEPWLPESFRRQSSAN